MSQNRKHLMSQKKIRLSDFFVYTILLTYGYDLALMPFNNFNTIITAQLFYNIFYILFVLIVNYFLSIPWCENDMIQLYCKIKDIFMRNNRCAPA